MKEDYKLSEKEHNKILEDLKSLYFQKALSTNKPEVVITGGQPASGKGRLARDSQLEFSQKGGSVLIDPDQLRQFHPKYLELQEKDDKGSSSHTHYDAKKWSLELIDEAVKQKKNIIVDQTSADFKSLKETVNNFRNNGYENIELKMMAVPEITSKQGLYHRYEAEKQEHGYGRFVPPEVHKEIYNKISDTMKQLNHEKLVNRLTVYDKNYNVVDSKNFENIRNKEFSEKEKIQHDYKWFDVLNKMDSRKAPYTEKEVIKDLQKEDRVYLNVDPNKNFYGLKTTEMDKLDVIKKQFAATVLDKQENSKMKQELSNQFEKKIYETAIKGDLRKQIEKQHVKEAEVPKPKNIDR